jgi:hypothetical protein
MRVKVVRGKDAAGGVQTPWFNLTGKLEESMQQGLILSLPILSVQDELGISTFEWGQRPEGIVKVLKMNRGFYAPYGKDKDKFPWFDVMPMSLADVPGSLRAGYNVLRPGEWKTDYERFQPQQLSPQSPRIEEAVNAFEHLRGGLPKNLDDTEVARKLSEKGFKIPLLVRMDAIKSFLKEFPDAQIIELIPGPLTLFSSLADRNEVIMAFGEGQADEPNSPLQRGLGLAADILRHVIRWEIDEAKATAQNAGGNGGIVAVGLLDPDATRRMIGPRNYPKIVHHTTRLVAEAHNAGAATILHICGNTLDTIPNMCATGTDVVHSECRIGNETDPNAIIDGFKRYYAKVAEYNSRSDTARKVWYATGAQTLQGRYGMQQDSPHQT